MSYDANPYMKNFHDKRVFVNEESLEVARQRRQANRDRLQRGLTDDKEPCRHGVIMTCDF